MASFLQREHLGYLVPSIDQCKFSSLAYHSHLCKIVSSPADLPKSKVDSNQLHPSALISSTASFVAAVIPKKSWTIRIPDEASSGPAA